MPTVSNLVWSEVNCPFSAFLDKNDLENLLNTERNCYKSIPTSSMFYVGKFKKRYILTID
ncbi:hypothetical protein VCRA2114E5_130065 [Vibrio crassostreae]|nr:hypothetical protein VCRA2114E5_130065 [Vibrio crassostreae]CAK2547567.1 hypothetical protein VCRA2110O2_120088 [Vibrio crassostreae]CAK3297350.1 hypothetical protein VCRA2126E14_150027 [Vibrio crassostreae]